MDISLTATEARVIGCLLEKESTTPDQYPLSLNALTSACNQKSNREPVMQLSETEVQDALDSLSQKRMIREDSSFGSRVARYKHRFCNTEFSELQFSEGQRAIVCILLLRGAQTPGELRTRSQRIHDFQNIQETEHALQALMDNDPALVTRLPRESGKRESRYCHLFSGTPDIEADTTTPASSPPAQAAGSSDLENRIQVLEKMVAEQQQRIEQLEALLSD